MQRIDLIKLERLFFPLRRITVAEWVHCPCSGEIPPLVLLISSGQWISFSLQATTLHSICIAHLPAVWDRGEGVPIMVLPCYRAGGPRVRARSACMLRGSLSSQSPPPAQRPSVVAFAFILNTSLPPVYPNMLLFFPLLFQALRCEILPL